MYSQFTKYLNEYLNIWIMELFTDSELLDRYLQEHSDAEFRESICENCSKALYPKYYKWKILMLFALAYPVPGKFIINVTGRRPDSSISSFLNP